MAGKNQVTLTLAGDSTQLEKAFGNVGAAAKSMGSDVDTASKSFDRVGEGFDTIDTRAMGFRDTMTGVEDSMLGVSAIAKGQVFDGLLLLGMGIGDLGSAFYNFLIPSMKSAVLWLGQTKVGMVAMNLWAGIVKGATIAWTGVQWLLNAALTANPIGIIIVGVGLLVAAIVLIATKTTWFQDLWRVVWTFVKDKAVDAWNWLKGLPEKIGSAFGKIARFITAPFRAAFNFVSDAWNNTVGKLSWTVPGWVPGFGGNTISAPQLPKFHAGGVVPGSPGSEMLAVLQAGERVVPNGGSGGRTVVELRSSGRDIDDLLVTVLARAIGARGGNVQAVLGR